MIKHKWVVFLVSILLSSCHAAPDSIKPLWRQVAPQMPQNATENYKRGWKDGCRSGLGNMTNSWYRTFHRWTQDPVLIKDPTYYKAWKDTYTFCRHYAYGIMRQSNTRSRNQNAIQSFHERMLGGHNPLEYNLGNVQGPGKAGLLFGKWGETGGSGFFEDWGNVLDFRKDMVFNGKIDGFGSGWVWDFTPTDSIVPYRGKMHLYEK